MEAAERTARQKEQAEKDKIERMNADLKEVLVICWLCGSGSGDDF